MNSNNDGVDMQSGNGINYESWRPGVMNRQQNSSSRMAEQ